MRNSTIARSIPQLVLLGVAVAISAPAVAQGNFRLGVNADIKEQLLPGQQIATLELAPASNARKPVSVREVLDRGLIMRHGGREPMTVRYVGYEVRDGRVVARSVSPAVRLQPGIHRVQAGLLLPGRRYAGGVGTLSSVDDGIIADQSGLDGVLQAALPRAGAMRQGETALVVFVVPDDATQRGNVGIRPVSMTIREP